MAEEKEEKKTSRKKSTTNKKTTTKKTTTRKTKVEKKEVVIPYQDELSTAEEKAIPYRDELSTVEEKAIPYQDELSTVEEKVIPYQDELSTVRENPSPLPETSQGNVSSNQNKLTEESKIAIGIIIVIGILLLVMGIIFGYSIIKTIPRGKDSSFMFITEDEDSIISNQYLKVDSSDQLRHLFPKAALIGLNFSQHDYVVLKINYDPCSEENITPVNHYMSGDKLYITIEYEAQCGGCAPSFLYYLVELEKGTSIQDVNFNYKSLNDPHCDPYVAYKPIIYFYPEKEEMLHVTLGYPEKLTITYPKYQNGWDVVAKPDGTLKDANGREYYSLFWEGNEHPATIKEDGFVVAGEDTQAFLEEKLQVLGLNDKEANEFIIYWLPKLENNTYNYIRFETMEEINQYMPLMVTPKPDHMIRIQMDYKPLVDKIPVQEQKLETPVRSGFTVVEWGGSIIG